jgi:plasmid stabilization system protein ParE
MKVRYSRPALADLDAILSDLAEKNSAAPARFEARISQIEERIGRFPEAFQQVESRTGYRRGPAISLSLFALLYGGCKQGDRASNSARRA